MLKFIKYLLWVVVIISLTAGLDALMSGPRMQTPGLKESQKFYVDFRSRLLGLFSIGGKPGATDGIEKVIEKSAGPGAEIPARQTRYLYVDKDGALQFADSYQQVPARYRKDAQPLAE